METSQEKNRPSKVHTKSSPESHLIEMEREFNVPVSRLFQAFTRADVIKDWWWPRGLYSDRIDFDFREGGTYFINMKGSDQGGGGMTGEFQEIVENKRIVMTDQFADATGRPISADEAKMPGVWPAVCYITFEFEEVDANKSRFLLSHEGIPNEMQKECIQGWSESFEKLESYLGGRKQ